MVLTGSGRVAWAALRWQSDRGNRFLPPTTRRFRIIGPVRRVERTYRHRHFEEVSTPALKSLKDRERLPQPRLADRATTISMAAYKFAQQDGCHRDRR